MVLEVGPIFDRMKSAADIQSDSELARVLEVTPQAIYKFKKQGRVPADLVVKYAFDAGLSLDWLVYGRGTMMIEDVKPGVHDAPQHEAKTEEEILNFRAELLVSITKAIIEISCPGIDEELAGKNATLSPEAMNILGKGREYVPSDVYIKKIIKLLSTLYDFYDSSEDDARSGEITDRVTLMIEKYASRGKARAEKEFRDLIKEVNDELP